jgi:sporulation protein YlmC with PRC-barrel domain
MQTTGTTAVRVLSSSTLAGEAVVDTAGEKLGKLVDLMIDLDRGKVAYAVLSVGGVLGVGDKLFAIPWDAFRVDSERKRMVLNAKREVLDAAPGFDKDNWPDFADQAWGASIYSHYGSRPFWE